MSKNSPLLTEANYNVMFSDHGCELVFCIKRALTRAGASPVLVALDLKIHLQGFAFAHQSHAFVEAFQGETVADEAVCAHFARCQQIERDA